MDYTELFHSLHPGFFDRESIRALPLNDVSAEQVLYLDRFVPEKTCFPFPDSYALPSQKPRYLRRYLMELSLRRSLAEEMMMYTSSMPYLAMLSLI